MKRAWHKNPRLIRHGVMATFFFFLLWVGWQHQQRGGGPRGTPSVEAYCPFGGVETAYQFLTTGGFVRHVEPSSLILMLAVLVLTLVVSRGFCGWVCPFGALQEWIGLLGKKLLKKRYNPTGGWDHALRNLKYVILVVIVGLTWYTGSLVFRAYDPFLAFFHFLRGANEMPWGYFFLGVTIVGSLFIERFFCKYACPLGAVLGIAGKLSLVKLERADDGCKGCNLCQKKCFAHIDFLAVNQIRDAECNHCLDCVTHCPKPNVLTVKSARWQFSHRAYAAVLVVGLLGFVAASQALGKWQTKPQMVSFTNRLGVLDADQIRGWMTLEDISRGYSIPLGELRSRAGLPEKVAPATRLNAIGREYNLEFEPDRMREVVRARLEGARQAMGTTPAAKGKKEHQPGEEPEVRGFMTLNEVALRTGVPKEYILKKMGVTAKIDPRLPLREWMHSQGKSIQDVRDAVSEYCRSRGKQ